MIDDLALLASPWFWLGAGYLLGSIPFGLVLTRIAGLGDIRKVGSGNIGTTNVLRAGGKGLAAATLLVVDDALVGEPVEDANALRGAKVAYPVEVAGALHGGLKPALYAVAL